jgi:predicted pyridoxine 5'-phosphate oxidase superfamily flavin-nucleotide-binding protein
MIMFTCYPSVEAIADQLRGEPAEFAEILADVAARMSETNKTELFEHLENELRGEQGAALRLFLRRLGKVADPA